MHKKCIIHEAKTLSAIEEAVLSRFFLLQRAAYPWRLISFSDNRDLPFVFWNEWFSSLYVVWDNISK